MEAALSASKHGLNNLTVLIDYNKQQSYGSTAEVLELEPFADKWRAFGFEVREVDGHDVEELRLVLKSPLAEKKLTCIVCHTVKGKGIDFLEGNPKWHHKSKLSDEEIVTLFEALKGYACAKPV